MYTSEIKIPNQFNQKKGRKGNINKCSFFLQKVRECLFTVMFWSLLTWLTSVTELVHSSPHYLLCLKVFADFWKVHESRVNIVVYKLNTFVIYSGRWSNWWVAKVCILVLEFVMQLNFVVTGRISVIYVRKTHPDNYSSLKTHQKCHV